MSVILAFLKRLGTKTVESSIKKLELLNVQSKPAVPSFGSLPGLEEMAGEIVRLGLETKRDLTICMLKDNKVQTITYVYPLGKGPHMEILTCRRDMRDLTNILSTKVDNVTFMMPGNDVLTVKLENTNEVGRQSLLVAPNEEYYGDRIGYGWVFLHWVRNGLADGSSVSRKPERVNGEEWPMKNISDAIRCYSSVYTTGSNDHNSEARWHEAKADISVDPSSIIQPDCLSQEKWNEKESLLKILVEVFLKQEVSNVNEYNAIENSKKLSYPPYLKGTEGIQPDTTVFPSSNAVYTRQVRNSACFYASVFALIVTSITVGMFQEMDTWGKLESALNLILTGAVAVVLALAGISHEGDHTIMNLIKCRKKLDNIADKRRAEAIIKQVCQLESNLGTYFDGPGTIWCSSEGGTTTITSDKISSEAFHCNAILLMSGSVLVLCGNQYRRVTNMNEKVWNLVPIDDEDIQALKNEKIRKVRLMNVAHDVGKISSGTFSDMRGWTWCKCRCFSDEKVDGVSATKKSAKDTIEFKGKW